MAGYGQTMLQGMQGILPLIRDQRMQEEMAWKHQLQQAQLQRQYDAMAQQEQSKQMGLQMQLENQRRLYQGMAQKGAQEGFRNNLALKGLDVRIGEIEERRREREAKAEEARRGTLKPGGWRWRKDAPDEQEPIPGGAAWQEMSGKHADDMGAVLANQEQVKSIREKLDEIMGVSVDPKTGEVKEPKELPAGFQRNFGGYNAALVTQFLPGEAQDWKAKLETLKSQMKTLGLNLTKMGAGSSIGSITQAEWPILMQQIESLDPKMSEAEAARAMRQIRNRATQLEQNVIRKYNTEWGRSPFHEKSFTPPAGVDPKIWAHMTPEEKALWAKKK